jgi:hypothetical protein
MTDTPDYQSVLDHMRARREEMAADLTRMDNAIESVAALLGGAKWPRAPRAPSAAPIISGLSPRPSAALTESAIRAALKNGADTAVAIRAQTSLAPHVVRLALRTMVESGHVTRTGKTHTTRYQLA